MNNIEKLRSIFVVWIILSFICLLSISGVYLVNREMNKIGLWVIAFTILSPYILLRSSLEKEFEEEYLILTIMTFMLWKDEKDAYFWTFMAVILSISMILIGLIKFAKWFALYEKQRIQVPQRYDEIL